MTKAPDIAELFEGTGRRKYLCDSELARFHQALRKANPATRAFCQLVALTGCRISEALATTPKHLDTDAQPLRYYIDYQAMARDAELNGELFGISTAYDVVHVFAGC